MSPHPPILARSSAHTGSQKRRPHLKGSSQHHSEGCHGSWSGCHLWCHQPCLILCYAFFFSETSWMAPSEGGAGGCPGIGGCSETPPWGREGAMLPPKQDEPSIHPRISCLPVQHGTWAGSKDNLPKLQSGKIFVHWFCVSRSRALTPPHCRGPQCLWELSMCCDCGRDHAGDRQGCSVTFWMKCFLAWELTAGFDVSHCPSLPPLALQAIQLSSPCLCGLWGLWDGALNSPQKTKPRRANPSDIPFLGVRACASELS